MPLSAAFIADFSSFDQAVQTSVAHLRGLETAGEKVDASLQQVTRSQDALLDEIGASGGHIQALGTTATATSGDVNTLSQSYRQFDGVLQAAGINIGPQVKGLEDIASAAGKGATELGLLGSAGLVVGTAMAAWNIGKMIGEMTGLTKAIEDQAAAWMGLGNMAEQTAGAKQDVINRAIAQGARETISYTEAIKYNSDQAQINADKHINWRDRLADAQREVRNLTAAQREDIAIAQEAGATTEQLTRKYGISAQGLEALADRHKLAAAATALHTSESEKLARAKEAEAAALDKAYAKLMSDVNNANGLAQMEADAAAMQAAALQKKLEAGANWMAQVNETAKATRAYTVEQDALTAANDALGKSVEQTGAAHLDAGIAAAVGTAQTVAGYQAVQQQVAITADGVRGWLDLMRMTNAANALLNTNSLFTTSSTLENQARLGTAFSPIPGMGGGGPTTNVTNTFNLTDSESNLAKRVSDLIMQQVRSGTQLGMA